MKKSTVIIVVLFGVSVLFAVRALFGNKYIPTHDGEYNIIRIVEFSKMLHAGYWFPRWAPTLNSGYGVPSFEFYYPFPSYIGSAISSFAHDAVRSFQISEGLGYIAAAVAVFGWLYTLFGVIPAVIGAVAGMFVPYWFVNMYVRGSVGEIWATAFLFAVLYLTEKKKYIFLAGAFALLILSHNILAMVYTPFILIYVLIRDKKALWSMIVGIGLSAYFWIPAIFEGKYVVGLNTVNFREHFVQPYELLIPSWGTDFSGTGSMANKISFQLGIASVISVIAAVFAHTHKDKDKEKKKLFIYLLTVAAISVFAMLSVSQPVWEIIKPMQFIQYPWRLLSFIIPVTAFMTAYWVSHMKHRWIGVVFATICVLLSSAYTQPVLYEPRTEAYYLSRSNFTDGTVSMGNSFSTIWTGWKSVRPVSDVIVTSGQVIKRTTMAYLNRQFTVSMADAGFITVNTLYFPGWSALVDNRNVPIQYQKDGVIHIPVPAGVHSVRVFMSETPVRLASDILSGLSLVFLIVWGILSLKNICRSR